MFLQKIRIWRIIFVFGAILITTLLGEVTYFYYVLTKNSFLQKADAIVVFAGGYERVKPAYGLANSGYAQYLIISPASENTLKAYNKKYDLSQNIKQLIEVKARTTFENALYTSKIIEEHNFDSVILITSSYHLPRSYFLLKALLTGEQVRVQPFGVQNDLEIRSDRQLSSIINRTTYNEMAKFWGSILEFIGYKVRGNVPEKNPNNTKFIRAIRSLFLADAAYPLLELS